MARGINVELVNDAAQVKQLLIASPHEGANISLGEIYYLSAITIDDASSAVLTYNWFLAKGTDVSDAASFTQISQQASTAQANVIAGLSHQFSSLAPGAYTLEVRAVDANAVTMTKRVNINLLANSNKPATVPVANTAPVIRWALNGMPPASAFVLHGQSVDFSVEGTDAENQALTYVWEVGGKTMNRNTYSGSSVRIPFSSPLIRASDQSVTVKVQAFDSLNAASNVLERLILLTDFTLSMDKSKTQPGASITFTINFTGSYTGKLVDAMTLTYTRQETGAQQYSVQVPNGSSSFSLVEDKSPVSGFPYTRKLSLDSFEIQGVKYSQFPSTKSVSWTIHQQ